MSHMPANSLLETQLISVRTYGAQGDGVTDDTASIQAALDAAATAGGVGTGGLGNFVVYVPASKRPYMFSNLKLPAYTTLQGTHIGQSVLRRIPGSTGIAIREKTVGEGNTLGATSIWIRDLGIDGNGTTGNGIDLGFQTANFQLQTWAGMYNVMAYGFTSGIGMHLNANAIALFYIYGLNNQDGIHFEGGAGNTVFGVFAENNSRYQVRANTVGSAFHGIQIEADTTSAAFPAMLVEGQAQSFVGVYISLLGTKAKMVDIAAGTNKTNLRDVFLDSSLGGSWTNGIFNSSWGVGTGTDARISEYVMGEGSNVSRWYINQSNGAKDQFIGDAHNLAGSMTVGQTLMTGTQNAVPSGTIQGATKIEAEGATSAAITAHTTGGDHDCFIGVEDASGAIVGTSVAQSLFLRTSNANRLTIDSAGLATFANTVRIGGASGGVISSGAGNPNSVVVGSPGDLYLSTGGTLFLKTSGTATNTGWSTVSTSQTFRVTRQVGDTDTIVINAGRGFLARASANYNVIATMGVNSLGVGVVGCDPASYTTTQFTLKLTSAWAAGDSILFTVQDLT